MTKPGILLACCAGVFAVAPAASADNVEPPTIDRVFFAQHHVLEPDSEYFKLVGGLEALIKVQVWSDEPVGSPSVVARLELDSRSLSLPLSGPSTLPKKPTGDPVLMEHAYEDSFTAIIPNEWVHTGLCVTVALRDYDYREADLDDVVYTNCAPGSYVTVLDQRRFDDLKIGAPTRMTLQMFDVHYFGRGQGADFPEGWERELEAKLPVADLTINRVRGIVFDEIVMPPQLDGPSARYSSTEDYLARTGKPYDGEQGIALRWGAALKTAAGRYGLWRNYAIIIGGVYSGGQAGGYRCCANLHRHGVLLHELGHTFGLPHWIRNRHYPYKRTMYGRDQGEECGPNAGPAWAFDVGRRDFIPARRMNDEGELVWKHDPMQGGGASRTKDYMYTQFSDYSLRRIQNRLEAAVYWNEELGEYTRWNRDTGAYDMVVPNDGVQFPLEREVDVISLMCSANLVVPDATIVYPPIGPYTAGVIRRFDASSAVDRQAAVELRYAREGCNVALRVVQGGAEKTYIMPARVSPDDDPLRAFNATAINLPARDGKVTKAELLYCPRLLDQGVTDDSQVLYTWTL